MPTRTRPETEAAALTTYVVVVDAVNVTTGRKTNGLPATTRLLRGSEINALPTDGRIVELLAQSAVVPKDAMKETMLALSKKGNVKRPTMQRPQDAQGHFRVTASGVSVSLGSENDPALNPREEFLPVDAAAIDTAPTVVES